MRPRLNLNWREIYEEYIREGMTLTDVGNKYNCNPMTVSRKFSEMGLSKNKRQYLQKRLKIDTNWKEWHQKWVDGKIKLEEIAAELGCSRTVVQTRFKEEGLPPKREPRPKKYVEQLPSGGNMNELKALVDYSTCQVVVYATQASESQKQALEKSGLVYNDEANKPVGLRVGEKIKGARIYKKLSLSELAQKAGMETSRLFSIESEARHENEPITFGELSRIADALERNVIYFTNGRVPGYWSGEWNPNVAIAIENLRLELEPDKNSSCPNPDSGDYFDIVRQLQKDCEELYTRYGQAQAILKAIAFNRPTEHLPDPGDNLPNLRKRIRFAVNRLTWYQLKNPRFWLGYKELMERYKMACHTAERVAQLGRKIGIKWLVTPAEVWLWERESSLKIGSNYPLSDRRIALR